MEIYTEENLLDYINNTKGNINENESLKIIRDIGRG